MNQLRLRTIAVICAAAILLAGCNSTGDNDTGTVSYSSAEAIPETDALKEEAAAASENTDEPSGEPAETDALKEAEEQTTEAAAMPEEYREILDNLYEYLSDDTLDMDRLKYGDETGILESSMFHSNVGPLNYMGYTLMDLDGNGTDELIITEESEEDEFASRILQMYTAEGDDAVFLTAGWARNRWFVLPDHRLYNQGSNGAAYSSFGTYHVGGEDGLSLVLDEYYFSDYAEYENPDSWGWFTNTTGEWDLAKSEPVDMTEEELYALRDSYEEEAIRLPYTLMADYPYEGPAELTRELILKHYERTVRRAGKMETELSEGALSQLDMNFLSADMYSVWDDYLNELWQYLVKSLPEDRMEALKEEQIKWIANKEARIEEVGKEYEGGSIRPLIENTEAADMTKERVGELMEYIE